jgi:hypothetical protein
VARASLLAYSSRYSRKDFTHQHQLFAALARKPLSRTDYRGVAAILADSSDLRAELGLTEVPHYSPYFAAGRLLRGGLRATPGSSV